MAKNEKPTPKVISKETQKRLIKDVVDIIKYPLTDQGIYYVHDEDNIFKNGDTVNIIESKPISKQKKWIVINSNGDQK